MLHIGMTVLSYLHRIKKRLIAQAGNKPGIVEDIYKLIIVLCACDDTSVRKRIMSANTPRRELSAVDDRIVQGSRREL